MKNIIFIALMCLCCTISRAQTPASCYNNPQFISANAHSLIDSYRDVVNKKGTITCRYDSATHYDCVTAAMPSKGYHSGIFAADTSKKVYGFVNFTSMAFTKNPVAAEKIPFHSMWAMRSTATVAGYDAIVCPEAFPPFIVFPFAETSQNHVFEAIFVTLTAYQTARKTEFLELKKIAISSSDIKAINDAFLECPNEFMSRKETVSYNNVFSSKGIICQITLKSGRSVLAYLINNYDGGTVLWKEKRK